MFTPNVSENDPIWHIISFQWSCFNHQLKNGIKKRVLLCGSSLHLYRKKNVTPLFAIFTSWVGFPNPVGFLEDGLPAIVSSDRIHPPIDVEAMKGHNIRKGLFHNPPNLGGR